MKIDELRALQERSGMWTVAEHNGIPRIVFAGDFDDVRKVDVCDFVLRMRDALPALIDVAEAARDWFEFEGFDRLVPEFFSNGAPGWKYRRIWQALAKLSEIENGHSSTETNVIGDEK